MQTVLQQPRRGPTRVPWRVRDACPEQTASVVPIATQACIDHVSRAVLTLSSVVKFLPFPPATEITMMRPAEVLVLLFAALAITIPRSTEAQTIYRWRDANGGVHYSNEPTRTPQNAAAVELPPLGSIQGPAVKRTKTSHKGMRREALPAMPCGPADPSGLMSAVSRGLSTEHPDETLTLLVGGLALSADPDATVQSLVTPWDPDAPQAHLSQAAIAFPTGTSCPTVPPLVRYPTTSTERASRGLCDDYRRAFAQVGVATSRDAGVARSFGDIAQRFVRVQLEGNNAVASGFRTARGEGMLTSDAAVLSPYMTVPLDPWIVKAHVSQTEHLAGESDELVAQLTVALEEIDRAARAVGCWN